MFAKAIKLHPEKLWRTGSDPEVFYFNNILLFFSCFVLLGSIFYLAVILRGEMDLQEKTLKLSESFLSIRVTFEIIKILFCEEKGIIQGQGK